MMLSSSFIDYQNYNLLEYLECSYNVFDPGTLFLCSCRFFFCGTLSDTSSDSFPSSSISLYQYSLYHTLIRTLSLSLSIYLFLSFCLSVSLSVCLSLCLSLYLSLTHSLSLSHTHSFSPSFSLLLSLPLSLSFSFSIVIIFDFSECAN